MPRSPNRSQARGWIGTGGSSGVCERRRLDEDGGEARGAGSVEALGKDRAPLGCV